MAAAELTPSALVAALGGRYADGLGIRLEGGASREIFKWFLAALLYGARISEALASRTHREFMRAGLDTPRAVVDTGWDGLVVLLDRGGYVRYDYKTATKLLDVCGALLERYGGDLNALHRAASSPADLALRLRALGKGIGEVTANIFLRELRGVWEKAEPLPAPAVIEAACRLGFLPPRLGDPGQALVLLKRRWARAGRRQSGFADFEAALLRHWRAGRRRQGAGRRAKPG